MRWIYVPLMLWLPGACSQSVVTTDAGNDLPLKIEAAMDVEVPIDSMDVVERDMLDVSVDSVDVIDVVRYDARAVDNPPVHGACEHDPPTGPAIPTNRSCDDPEVPGWHCNEVHFCGGSYQIGDLAAYDLGTRMDTCMIHTGNVRSGYVDAYEVTVARFRAWVLAGRPQPSYQADFFAGVPWRGAELDKYNYHTGDPAAPCTFEITPHIHDDLPMNCVPAGDAAAFCWWDGKHLMTEVAWEYVARNSGTTATPMGNVPTPAAACAIADVGRSNGSCSARAMPAPVQAFPMDVTRDPPGVYGMFGGLSEFAMFGPPNYRMGCRGLSVVQEDGFRSPGFLTVVHGAAWNMMADQQQRMSHSASRYGGYSTRVSDGFRCARWSPEPRGTR
jgi:formylglycine-generating enzyme required for sulfatase activity